jgi:hypothetical protein
VSPFVAAAIAFGCIGGGMLLGMSLRARLPDDHLSDNAKSVVNLGMGFVGTMAALALGLLTASANDSFATRNNEIRQGAVEVVLLDRTLAQYGPETQEVRGAIRRALAAKLAAIWPEEGASAEPADQSPRAAESIDDVIRNLVPRTDAQRGLQSRALELTGQVLQTRWSFFGSAANTVPLPFLIALVVWISVIFTSFGLFAPRNATVTIALLVCAASIAGAIFLILEMSQPFDGLLKVSSAPLRYALAHLGQ